MYQMTTKYTKGLQNVPNDHKIFQITTKYVYQSVINNTKNLRKIHQLATICSIIFYF
jgi:hypothetical protein